ncbi:PAF acetylhydrolase [Xylariaceae sp. FL0804]|nr:PAF acetylhydrolase [Xylariaceae sp. FL0804]
MPAFSKAPPYGGRSSAARRRRISAVLRPRLTWRYVVCSVVLLYFLYCSLFSLPLLSSPLPEYSGPYHVGAIDIEAPAPSPRLVDTARFKHSKANAFELQTTLFTLYYPTNYAVGGKPKHYWVPKPISVTAEGYAKFAHIGNFITNALFTGALRALVGGIQIPASVDVPLAQLLETKAPMFHMYEDEAEKVLTGEEAAFPVIVFSHGMASSRTDYTHYAGELASRGYVVAMLEHRDGSCPGSVITRNGGGAPEEQIRTTFRMSEVESVDGGGAPLEVDDFKRAQLNFREAEIEEAVRVLGMINSGRGDEVFEQNPRGEGAQLAGWAGKLNMDEMVVAGHSYGATGALQALKGAPNEKRPFKGGIILDPGKQSGRLNADVDVPLLIIHSNSWSSRHSLFYGRAHFDVVRDLAAGANAAAGRGENRGPAWFATSLGTAHPSVTDAGLLQPALLGWATGARVEPREGLRQYVHVAEDFMRFVADGARRGLLAEPAEFPAYDEGRGFGAWQPGQGQGDDDGAEEKGPWWDWRRYWQVHVAPAA